MVPKGIQQTEPAAKNKDVGVKRNIDELDELELHKLLVKQHRNMLNAVRAYFKAEAKWQALLSLAFEMEVNSKQRTFETFSQYLSMPIITVTFQDNISNIRNKQG